MKLSEKFYTALNERKCQLYTNIEENEENENLSLEKLEMKTLKK